VCPLDPHHSLFTYCLLRALGGGTIDGRRLVTGTALGGHLTNRVAEIDPDQIPDSARLHTMHVARC
jgi:hypothetical protein